MLKLSDTKKYYFNSKLGLKELNYINNNLFYIWGSIDNNLIQNIRLYHINNGVYNTISLKDKLSNIQRIISLFNKDEINIENTRQGIRSLLNTIKPKNVILQIKYNYLKKELNVFLVPNIIPTPKKVITESTDRSRISMHSLSVTANCVEILYWGDKKQKAEVDDLFLLNSNGNIVSTPNANIFILKNDYLLTPKNDGSFYPGFTRNYINTIFNSAKFKKKVIESNNKLPLFIHEKEITKADLLVSDGIFICNEFNGISPVIEVDKIPIPQSPISKLLFNIYEEVLYGNKEYGIPMETI